MTERAPRNKTLQLSADQERQLSERVIRLTEQVEDVTQVLDRTIEGDCTRVLSLLPDGIADLVVADPPYNMDKRFKQMRFRSMSDEAYEEYLDGWMKQLCAKLKPNGSIYVCCDWRSSSAVARVMSRYFTMLNRITWQREKGRGAKANWKNSMEDIWFGVRNPEEYYFDLDSVKMKRRVLAPYRTDEAPRDWQQTAEGKFRMTCPSNFWDDITVPYWSMPENTEHPTQKPEKLVAKLILASSAEGGVVLDPFLGSGTTSVVARKLGRHYIGIEIDPHYCCIAEHRLAQAADNITIQGYSDGVFWERNTLLAQRQSKKREPNL